MTNYNFNKLLDSKSFELLGKDILEIRENLKFEVFSDGIDQGIDIRYEDNEKLIVGQVKRYKEFNSLYNDLKNKEIKKVEKLNPDRYIIITSVELNPSRKSKIKELFAKYIISSTDIIGEAELNDYLGSDKYKIVEESYYQLWINSSNVLKNIIKREIHSEIYNKTQIVFKEIKESNNTYVKNDYFDEYFKKLEKMKCLLVCGEAGIGKTTLAYNLISNFLTKYKETEFMVIDNIRDFYKLYNEEQTQLVFIDDFWGIKYSEEQKTTDLKEVIEIISKSNNKYLILTSREYILKQGYVEYPELEVFFDKYKINLSIEDFDDLFKARILFRNLENSNLEYSALYQLVQASTIIIHNPNYNPRIISTYLSHINNIEYEIIDYEEDIIKYLNNPQELWKEIFSKQCEGAQLFAILILLFSNPVNLDNIKELFYNCLDNNCKINARKKEFTNYISQLENNIITTYEDSSDNNIYFRFKNSSIELYVYSYFNMVIDEYGETIIKSSKCLNSLIRLSNCNNTMSYDYNIDYNVEDTRFNVNEELQNKIIDKIINEFDELYYIDESEIKEAYIEKGSCVPQLIEVMYLYKELNSLKLKEFIYKKTEDIMKKFYEQTIFNYNDSLVLFEMIKLNIEFNIDNKFNLGKLFEKYLEKIRFSRQMLFLKWNEDFFPLQYRKFLKEKEIKGLVIESTISDAEYFYDEVLFSENKEKVYGMMDELTNYTIPQLFEEFKIKYKKWYVEEIYDLTGNKLMGAKKEWLNELDYGLKNNYQYKEKTEHKKRKLSYKEELEIIENEREKILNNYFETEPEEEEIHQYLNDNLKNKELVGKIIDLYNNFNNYSILPLLKNYNKIEFLGNYLNYINRLDKNIPEFFNGIITYLKSNFNYINDNTVRALKQLSYITLKEDKKTIYESQFLKYISIDELEDLKESKIIYNKGKKYYFITKELHLIFGLYESIDVKESLIDIFNKIILSNNCDFCGFFYDICDIYSEIDVNEFNNNFLLPILKKVIKSIENDDKSIVVENFIKLVEACFCVSIETNEENDKYIELESNDVASGNEIIALEYLGFCYSDLIYTGKSDKEMMGIFEKYIPINDENLYEINLSGDYDKLQGFVKEMGIYDYIYNFYELIRQKINELKNPNY